MLQIDIILLFLTAAVLICCMLARAPKTFSDLPRDVLICAAHSDDCVIMGAEYSYGAVDNGCSVRIAYLTCSGPHPNADISRTRSAEALAAWSALGVPEKNLTFINLSESPVGGPPSYSDQDIANAEKILKSVILSLPKGAAVMIPANGESHVDHRTIRKVSLVAIEESQREDLLVYESPEYNAFLSLIHCPKRTFLTVLRHVPFLNRVVKPYTGRPNYVDGAPGFVFRDTPRRLARKKELLGYFPSQNVALLIQYFGYETPYRKVSVSERHRGPNKVWRFTAFGCCCDPSVLALGFTLLIITLLTTYEVSNALTLAFTPMIPADNCLVLLGGALASAYFVRRLRRTVSLETSLVVWAAAFGIILGAL